MKVLTDFSIFPAEFRSVSSEVSSDLIIQVKGSRYLLHKVNLMNFSQILIMGYVQVDI